MIDREEAMVLQRRGLEENYRVLAATADGSRLMEYPGVIAACVPACPTRSFPNGIVYESAEELSAAIDALAAEYRHAGIRAFTVWVPEGDRAAARIVEGAGHVLDAAPMAMVIELADLPDPDHDLDGLDWDDEATPAEMGRINDLAYGWGDTGFAPAFVRNPAPDVLRLFRARADDGSVACVCATMDVDDDCYLAMVATDPDHRGQGLAQRLCHGALLRARDRGLATSSLHASATGKPIYDRLGYDTVCAVHMWECRD